MCFFPGISTPIILGIVVFTSCLSYLALTLLMARVSADHAHHALAANDAAVLANATNGTTYFHCVNTLSEWSNEDLLYHIARESRKGVKLESFCPEISGTHRDRGRRQRPACRRVDEPL